MYINQNCSQVNHLGFTKKNELVLIKSKVERFCNDIIYVCDISLIFMIYYLLQDLSYDARKIVVYFPIHANISLHYHNK